MFEQLSLNIRIIITSTVVIVGYEGVFVFVLICLFLLQVLVLPVFASHFFGFIHKHGFKGQNVESKD